LSIWLFTTTVNSISFFGKNKYITDFAGFSRVNAFLAISLSIIVLSMSGIPPLAGFFAKFVVLFSLVNNSFFSMAFLAIVSSMIGTFYYLRWVKII